MCVCVRVCVYGGVCVWGCSMYTGQLAGSGMRWDMCCVVLCVCVVESGYSLGGGVGSEWWWRSGGGVVLGLICGRSGVVGGWNDSYTFLFVIMGRGPWTRAFKNGVRLMHPFRHLMG